jgi:hypothetical protein
MTRLAAADPSISSSAPRESNRSLLPSSTITTKHFWIDALCIDQTNIAERNHQVQMMGQIYSSSAFVLVWLGTKTNVALSFLRRAPSRWLGDLRRSSSSAYVVEDMRSFFGAPYWKRAWIIQEFVLAKQIHFLSQTDMFPFEAI